MQAADPLFAATLSPHRALSRRGLRWLVAFFAILASIPGVVFFSLGAWPIVGFLGLDVLAVWWALTASRRDGRRREKVTLWADCLEIIATSAGGRAIRTEFHPSRVRLIVERDIEERTTGLKLREHDRELIIGAFLSTEEKGSFARVFGTALRKARDPNPARARRPTSRERNKRS